MEKEKISVKKTLEYGEAMTYMDALVKCFKSGTIVVESGEDFVTMKPAGSVNIKLEAKSKKDKQKISFEIGWTDACDADLKISDKEPVTNEVVVVEPGQAPATKPSVEETLPMEKKDSPVPATTSPDPASPAAPKTAAAKAKKSGAKKSAASKNTTPKKSAVRKADEK